MKRYLLSFALSLLAGLAFLFFAPVPRYSPGKKAVQHTKAELKPNEVFMMQRSYPEMTPDVKALREGLAVAKKQAEALRSSSSSLTGPWTTQGPGNIGGKINTIAVDPFNSNIIYVGCSTGGVFKTTDGGTTWNPLFDDMTVLAIGCITIDPNNSNIVYVGTGDPHISGYPWIGDGVYKSTDAGVTWTHIGLQAACIISNIVIDPSNSNILYAAAMGVPFVRSPDRGLYKSTDGGNTWSQVLYVDDDAGVTDVVIDPVNTQNV